ncbi:hypothetical protein SK128_008056 [Halocaridina rubra]|uniref:Uncharacterized protein n=1 Tax=Halocaridina rubra TaxID=373956 RepID=A0AAN8WII2_HALRR
MGLEPVLKTRSCRGILAFLMCRMKSMGHGMGTPFQDKMQGLTLHIVIGFELFKCRYTHTHTLTYARTHTHTHHTHTRTLAHTHRLTHTRTHTHIHTHTLTEKRKPSSSY